MEATYDRIGAGYSQVRRPDQRLACGKCVALPAGRWCSPGTPPMIEPAMERLRADIGSGAWADRHRYLLGADRIEYGYRLLVAG